jgi:sensor histidine kinase YesM
LLHGIVWAIFFYLNVRYLQNWLPSVGLQMPLWQLILYSVLYVPLLFSVPYLHYFILLPRFYFRRKYGRYVLWLVISFIAGCYATSLLDSIFLMNKGQNWLMTAVHIWSRIPLLGLFTLLASWARMTEEMVRQQRRQQQLQQQQTEAELRWLKAQVSPHFLFNALNNIHSLVQMKSDAASPMIVKLSEMMRYLLHESNAERVPLDKEIEYVKNYIELQTQKQRWLPRVEFKQEGNISGMMIAPLLLINFVENAFKHSNLDEPDAFVHIRLTTAGATVLFEVRNSYPTGERKDETQGIGLTNVRQRLQLLYPGKHTLQISSKGGVYEVRLELRQ